MKIIYSMPQVQILDRHPITTEERIKAAKLDPEYERKQAKFVQPKKIKPIPVSQAFSKGEKDLYKQVDQIKMATIRQEQTEELKRQSVTTSLSYHQHPSIVLPGEDVRRSARAHQEAAEQGQVRLEHRGQARRVGEEPGQEALQGVRQGQERPPER